MTREEKIQFLQKLKSGQVSREEKVKFLQQRQQQSQAAPTVDEAKVPNREGVKVIREDGSSYRIQERLPPGFAQPEAPVLTDEERLAKAEAAISREKVRSPEAFTETGEVAEVDVGPGLGEQAAGFAAGVGRGASMGLSDVAAGVGGMLEGKGYEAGREEFQRQYEQLPETARTVGEVGGAIATGIGAGATKQLAPLAQKAGLAGLGARVGIGAGEGAISGVAKEGLTGDAAIEAGLGAAGALGGEALGAVAKKAIKPAVSEAAEKATKKVDDIKKSISKVWKDEGPDGQYILDMMGEAGNKFRETLGLGGAGARKTEVGPLKEKVLRQKMEKISKKLKAQIGLKSKSLKDTYEDMYNEAYESLKGVEPIHPLRKEVVERTEVTGSDALLDAMGRPIKEMKETKKIQLRGMEGLELKNMPENVKAPWKRAQKAKDAASQAKALKEVRKSLRNLSKDQIGALFNANQNPKQALAYIDRLHSEIPGLGEADQFYRQDMELKDLVKSIGKKTQRGGRVITGETARKLGGESESFLTSRAGELPEDIGEAAKQAGAEFRQAQEGLKVQPGIEETQQRLAGQLSPEERALEEIRLQQAQERKFGDVMHSSVVGEPDLNVQKSALGAADVAAATQTGAGGIASRLANMVGLGEGFEKVVRTNPGRAMLELAVAERKAQEALQSGSITREMYDRLVSDINTLRMGAGSGAAALGGE